MNNNRSIQRSYKVVLIQIFMVLGIVATFARVITSIGDLHAKTEVLVEHRMTVSKVHEWLSVYNPKTTWEEAEEVERIITSNGLQEWRWELVSQLCVESGASQFDRRSGKVKRSVAGALGISQIKPTTAFHVLRYELKEEDRKLLEESGASSLSWVMDFKYGKSDDGGVIVPGKATKRATEWLGRRTNNLLLWGVIMRRYKDIYGSFDRAAVAYSRGKTGLLRYEKNGHPSDHFYARHVDRVKQKLSDLPS